MAELAGAGRAGSTPDDPGLLDEVTDLVEQPDRAARQLRPRSTCGLPKEVLITVMKKHQRYFPVVAPRAGALLPYFITVRNGPREYLDSVREGQRGRDPRALCRCGLLLPRRTRPRPLEEFTPRLATLTFQEKLGSMLDKVAPGRAPRRPAGRAAGAGRGRPRDRPARGRPLQERPGDADGGRADVAAGHHGARVRPHVGRAAGSRERDLRALPAALPGRHAARHQARPALGIANRLDSLVGLFAVGLAPTSTADPFGLRRDALGLVGALVGCKQSFGLQLALQTVAAEMPVPVAPQVLTDVLGFIRDRLFRLAARPGACPRRGRRSAGEAQLRSVPGRDGRA